MSEFVLCEDGPSVQGDAQHRVLTPAQMWGVGEPAAAGSPGRAALIPGPLLSQHLVSPHSTCNVSGVDCTARAKVDVVFIE